jgi:steroid delta-isomerase-like uncharacterized protein
MSAQDNAKLVRALYDAWNNRDWDTYTALVDDDTEVLAVATGQTLRGRPGFRQYGEIWASAFPDARVEVTNVVASEDGAVVEFRGRGTHTAPLVTAMGEIPATNKRVDQPFCDVYSLQNGRVRAQRAYFDIASLKPSASIDLDTPAADTTIIGMILRSVRARYCPTTSQPMRTGSIRSSTIASGRMISRQSRASVRSWP